MEVSPLLKQARIAGEDWVSNASKEDRKAMFALKHRFLADPVDFRRQFVQEKNDQDCGAHRFLKLIEWENNDWRAFWKGKLGVIGDEVPSDVYVLAFAEGAFAGIA